MTLKQYFEERAEKYINRNDNYQAKLVVGVSLPNGATEIIINTEYLEEKINYYINAYDNDFKLKTNPNVEIINFMFV